MPMGFSSRTGLPLRRAKSTSLRWQALGVVTKTASTSLDLQSSSGESKARGISYCRAEARACSRLRRLSALTVQFFDWAKPGISRLTACNPKPSIPKRIISGVGIEDENSRGQRGQHPPRPVARRESFPPRAYKRIEDETRGSANADVVREAH